MRKNSNKNMTMKQKSIIKTAKIDQSARTHARKNACMHAQIFQLWSIIMQLI